MLDNDDNNGAPFVPADPGAHLLYGARNSSLNIMNPETWAPFCVDEVSIRFLLDEIKDMLSIRAQPFFQVQAVIRLLNRYCHLIQEFEKNCC